MIMSRFPSRIICLTEETTETLYLLGQQDRIVGISGYTVRPPEAKQEKPIVSAFINAKIDKIIGLEPDLVLGFSDLQADIAAELIRAGLNVMIYNQRSLEQIFDVIHSLGALTGTVDKATELVDGYRTKIEAMQTATASLTKPKVYFEEWDEPLITGIRWVHELIEVAGGENCFAEKAEFQDAKRRIIEDNDEVIRRNPDIMMASWCGKPFELETVLERKGWQEIQAIKDNQIFEIPSEIILQPGPAALSDGLDVVHKIITDWHSIKT